MAVTEAVVEEVAQNLEEMAEVTRRFNPSGVSYFLGGLVVGAAVGFYFGHRWNKEKLKLEAFEESAEEVRKIREVYQQKAVAAEPKGDLNKIIEDRGYSTAADREEITTELSEEQMRPLIAPVPIREEIEIVESKNKDDGWDYPKELETRSASKPYVIHQDEFNDPEIEYDHVTYTYFEADDVLVDDADNEPVLHPDMVVGQDNLKFGHGSDDLDVVYVRNDRLQQEMEICRSQRSYEEDVMGLNRDESA